MTAARKPIRTRQATTGTRVLHSHGVKPAEVAALMGAHHTVVTRYFTGAMAPPAAFLAALRELLPDEAAADHVFSLCPRRERPDGPRSTAPTTVALHARGLNLADLAREMQPPQETMSRWVNGHRPAPAELRTALRRLLGEDAGPAIASIHWRDQ